MLSCWKKLFIVLQCGLVLSCTLPPKQPGKAEVIQQLLDSLYNARVFNGAVVIGEGDSIIFSKGYGYANFNDSIPFTIYTRSDGGSLAKTFTVLALRRLQKTGAIDLRDAVTKYLPQFPYPGITVLDLITHNAGGLPDYDYFFPKTNDTAILTNEVMLLLLNKYKPLLLDTARQGFNYENCGMDLGALIIEKITGKSYQQVLSEIFFSPLHMNSTYVRPAHLATMNTNRAVGYQWKNDSLLLNDIADREGFYGGGNLHFTTADLHKWGESFYRSDMHDEIMKEANQPARIDGKTSGLNQLNWYYATHTTALYYWGNVAGFYSHLFHDDQRKFTIAFMTNTTLPYSLRQPVATALAEIMETGNYNHEHFHLPPYTNLKNPEYILGNYSSINGESIHIFRDKGLFHIQRNKELRYNMFIVDSTTAYVPGIDAWIGFTKTNNHLVLHWNSIFHREKMDKIN